MRLLVPAISLILLPLLVCGGCVDHAKGHPNKVTGAKTTAVGDQKSPRRYHVHPVHPRTAIPGTTVTKMSIVNIHGASEPTTEEKNGDGGKKARRIRVSRGHRRHHHKKRSENSVLPTTTARPVAVTVIVPKAKMATTSTKPRKMPKSIKKNLPLGPHGHGPHGGNYRL